MALLKDQVDPDTIHMVGRWQSKIMLRYQHKISKSFTEVLAVKISQNGTHAFIPYVHACN